MIGKKIMIIYATLKHLNCYIFEKLVEEKQS
jgi:hypothetical protein